MKFWGIKNVAGWWGGENMDKKVNRREGFWIYDLQSIMLSGPNIKFEIKCFLKD